jgi:hypothetical protein
VGTEHSVMGDGPSVQPGLAYLVSLSVQVPTERSAEADGTSTMTRLLFGSSIENVFINMWTLHYLPWTLHRFIQCSA